MSRRFLVITVLLICGCTVTLEPAVRRTLPDSYEVRRPANTKALLGTVIDEEGVVLVNDCYGGTLNPADPSWSSVVVKYKRSGRGTVKGDFGDAVSIEGEGGGTISGTVTLQETAVLELKDLYFLPTGPCATDDNRRALYSSQGGHQDMVVIRAVRAANLLVTNSTSSKTKLKATVPIQGNPVHAGVEVETENSATLAGKNLFYAEQIAPATTKLMELEPVEISTGGSTDRLGPCWVLLEAVGDVNGSRKWTGQLACEDGVSYIFGKPA